MDCNSVEQCVVMVSAFNCVRYIRWVGSAVGDNSEAMPWFTDHKSKAYKFDTYADAQACVNTLGSGKQYTRFFILPFINERRAKPMNAFARQ